MVPCQAYGLSSLVPSFLAGSKSLRIGSASCCCLGPQIANKTKPNKLRVHKTMTQQIFVVPSKSVRFRKWTRDAIQASSKSKNTDPLRNPRLNDMCIMASRPNGLRASRAGPANQDSLSHLDDLKCPPDGSCEIIRRHGHNLTSDSLPSGAILRRR